MSLASQGSAVEGGTATFTSSKTKIMEDRKKGIMEGIAPTVKFSPGTRRHPWGKTSLLRKKGGGDTVD